MTDTHRKFFDLARRYAVPSVPGADVEDLQQEAAMVVLAAGPCTARELRAKVRASLRRISRAARRERDLLGYLEEVSAAGDERDEYLGWEDLLGAPATQEAACSRSQTGTVVSRIVKGAKVAAQTRKRSESTWGEIIALREQGLTLAEIGKRLGKSPQAVHAALARAQRRLGAVA